MVVVAVVILAILLGILMNRKKRYSHLSLYGRDSCPYTVKMKDELDNNSVSYRYLDTDTQDGIKEFKDVMRTYDHDGGVPFMVCSKNRRTATGFMSKSSLFQKLGL